MVQTLIFVSRDQPGDTKAAREVAAIAPNVRVVDKLSSKLADLKLVARYGVVEPVVTVFLKDRQLHGRLTRLPTVVECCTHLR